MKSMALIEFLLHVKILTIQNKHCYSETQTYRWAVLQRKMANPSGLHCVMSLLTTWLLEWFVLFCTITWFGLYWVRLDWTYFCWNWKHCSKIIFKCVNNAVWPIFNEKIAEKWNLWIRKQCTNTLFIVEKSTSAAEQKKKKKKIHTTKMQAQQSVESKHSHYISNERR